MCARPTLLPPCYRWTLTADKKAERPWHEGRSVTFVHETRLARRREFSLAAFVRRRRRNARRRGRGHVNGIGVRAMLGALTVSVRMTRGPGRARGGRALARRLRARRGRAVAGRAGVHVVLIAAAP